MRNVQQYVFSGQWLPAAGPHVKVCRDTRHEALRSLMNLASSFKQSVKIPLHLPSLSPDVHYGIGKSLVWILTAVYHEF